MVVKYRYAFTIEELRVMRDRLIPVSPMDYDLKTYAIIRDLYGRFAHKVQKIEIEKGEKL